MNKGTENTATQVRIRESRRPAPKLSTSWGTPATQGFMRGVQHTFVPLLEMEPNLTGRKNQHV